MKKIIASVVAMLATVSMVACGDIENDEYHENDTTIVTTTTTTTSITTIDTISNTTMLTTTEVSTQTTEITVIETEPQVYETETPAAEIVVETQSDNPQPETFLIEPEPVPIEFVEEYLVYKPSTHYIHKSTCRWNSGDAYRVDCTTELVARLCDECNPDVGDYIEYVEPEPEVKGPTTVSSEGLTYFGYFGRVTYYPATAYYSGVCGGSGRTLMGYDYYDNGIRGSIASRTLYETYGYNRNGRTTVYLEFPGYENMNGYYYVDDCCRDYGVIDIFVWSSGSCPFYNAGVITADCYV